MTIEQLKDIVLRVNYPDHRWLIGDDGSSLFIQIAYDEVDVDEPERGLREQRGRKWKISRWMIEDEVFRTMLAASLASAEHRVREHFLVDGVRVFGPHLDINQLIEFVKQSEEKRRPKP